MTNSWDEFSKIAAPATINAALRRHVLMGFARGSAMVVE
jgi:hypothetical protein